MQRLFVMMAAGSMGIVLRWTCDILADRYFHSIFPWSTFTVNILGSFLIGLASSVLTPGPTQIIWITGFLGGLTTFSSFSLQIFRLIERGSLFLAILYTLGSVLLGLCAVALGISAGRYL